MIYSYAVVYSLIPASTDHRLTSALAVWEEPRRVREEDEPRARRVADSLKTPPEALLKDSVSVLYTSLTSLKLFALSIDSTTVLL